MQAWTFRYVPYRLGFSLPSIAAALGNPTCPAALAARIIGTSL
jgi:hypothetical protein